MQTRPKIAIVDSNTLAILGLKALLQDVIPIMTVETFGSYAELEANHPEEYVHYFVNMNIVLENHDFFSANRRKTIVLTTSQKSQMAEFHCLCTNVPEKSSPHAQSLVTENPQ